MTALFLWSGPPPTLAAPLIDAHNHLHLSSPGKSSQAAKRVAAAAIAAMDEFGITAMVVMPPPFTPGHHGMYGVDKLKQACSYAPSRLFFLDGGGTLNPMILKAHKAGTTTDADKREFRAKAMKIIKAGARGFGEMGAEHFCLGANHNYHSAPPDHPLYLLLADIAAQHGVPIDIHMEAIPRDMPTPDLNCDKNPKRLSPNIPAFERLLRHNPKASIIWAHVGWDNTGARDVALCKRLLTTHPNLYMSFKISPRDSLPQNRPLKNKGAAIKPEWLALIRAFPDRFIIGTDQFYVPPGGRKIGPQRTQASMRFSALLPEDVAEKVLFRNAAALFGINIKAALAAPAPAKIPGDSGTSTQAPRPQRKKRKQRVF